MTAALTILQREHRALAAVLHCFDQVLKEVHDKRLEPDFALFEAILQYVQDFPDRFHHPKEDELLFPVVRRRAPEVSAALDLLAHQHEEGVRHTNELKWRLAAWKEDGAEAFSAFETAARAYIDFQRRHIGLEEREIIPAALRTLTPADWTQIDSAFAANEDPMFGERPKVAFDALFSRIATLAPEPHGLGRRKEPAPAPDAAAHGAHARGRIVDLHWI